MIYERPGIRYGPRDPADELLVRQATARAEKFLRELKRERYLSRRRVDDAKRAIKGQIANPSPFF